MNTEWKKVILFLAANPKGTSPLRLDKEVRKIEEALRRSQYREQFEFKSKWAVCPDDLRRALLDFRPQIVHFCGHGAGEEGLVLEQSDEASTSTNSCLVSGEALANLYKQFKQQLECVVLNACYSEIQANAISQHIDYVVGMKQDIGDESAIKFSVGFYDALGGGETVESAYGLGCNAIELNGLVGHLTPILKKKTIDQRSPACSTN